MCVCTRHGFYVFSSTFRHTSASNVSQQAGRTEKVQNCLCPKFAKKFVVDYYFEIVQKLKFGIYDIDNTTVDLNDDDFLGELECTLGQVKFASLLEQHNFVFTKTQSFF